MVIEGEQDIHVYCCYVVTPIEYCHVHIGEPFMPEGVDVFCIT